MKRHRPKSAPDSSLVDTWITDATRPELGPGRVVTSLTLGSWWVVFNRPVKPHPELPGEMLWAGWVDAGDVVPAERPADADPELHPANG